jgi:hypothetical protein
MYLPLEYQMKYAPRAYGGIVIDASETGFHIYSTENIPLGTKLKIEVFFPDKYELANLEVEAEIVWKKVSVDRRGMGYQYGLKFLQILEEDCRTLRKLLGDRSTSGEGSNDL